MLRREWGVCLSFLGLECTLADLKRCGLRARAPVPIRATQVDGGSAFINGFEAA